MTASPGSPNSPADTRASVGAKVARAVLTTSVSQLVLIVLGFASSVAQARLLGPAGRGDVARFVNAGALAVLYFGVGINSAITYFVASGALEPRALLRTLRSTFVVTVCAVLACTTLVATTPLQRFLPQGLGAGRQILTLTVFFALSQLGNWLAAVLAARGSFGPINSSTVVVGAVSAVASLALFWLRPAWADAGAIIMLNVGLEGLRSAMLAWLMWQAGRGSPRAPSMAAAASAGVGLTQLVRYSALTYLGEALQFLTYRFDMWVVDAYRGAADLGRYSLAVSLAQLVWIVPTATARVLFPYAAMLERADGAQLAWRAARVSLLVGALAALAGFIATQLFFTALFGPQFADVPLLLGILLLGIVPYSVAKVLGNYLAGVNALGTNVFASGTGLAIAVGLDLLLIPGLGARGAAWATALSYSLYTLLLFLLFLRKSGLPLREAFAWRSKR